jgi:hypothetical protein
MRYQSCRWYDVYPKLAFVLRLIRLIPHEKQMLLGERLNDYLDNRTIQVLKDLQGIPRGNRWYDDVETLVEGLERLKGAPHSVKQQSTDFLIHSLNEADFTTHCA